MGKIMDRWQASREASRRNREIVEQTHAAHTHQRKEDAKQERREREDGWQRVYSDDWQQRLGVQVRDGQVWEWPSGKHLGPLAGAQAGMTSITRSPGQAAAMTAAFGLAGLAAGGGAKASAHVTFTTGAVVITNLDNSKAITQAQTDIVRFNALVGACTAG